MSGKYFKDVKETLLSKDVSDREVAEKLEEWMERRSMTFYRERGLLKTFMNIKICFLWIFNPVPGAYRQSFLESRSTVE